MDLQDVVDRLSSETEGAYGAVLCDFEGESVVLAVGPAPLPEAAAEKAEALLPRALSIEVPLPEFLLRIAGAEPCALLHLFHERGLRNGVGDLAQLEARFGEVDLLVRRLPEEYYLVLVLHRAAARGSACARLEVAARRLTELLA